MIHRTIALTLALAGCAPEVDPEDDEAAFAMPFDTGVGQAPPPGPTCYADTLSITPPGSYSGSLATTDALGFRAGAYYDDVEFQGVAGTTYTVDLTSTAFDSFLYLLDSGCRVIASNDDSNGTLNSRIVFTAGASSVFTLIATTYAGNVVGAYRLAVAGGGGGAVVTPGWGSTSSVTGYTTDGRAPAQCPAGMFASGFDCNGRYCDDINLTCRTIANGTVGPRGSFGTVFSEENAPYDRYSCPSGRAVTGINCTGSYCDNLSLECTSVGTTSASYWSGSTWSEEHQPYSVPTDTYLCGLECDGRYCDNLRPRYCRW